MKSYTKVQYRLSRIFKALAHPARIKLIEDLMKGECCVGEIQKCLSLSQPNVSQHLKILKESGIVTGRRDQNRICYSISDYTIKKAINLFLTGDDGNENDC